jgi:dTDP-4-dehydrorhamnose 3,5-epimerase
VKLNSLPLAGTFEVLTEPVEDPRGYFARWYDRDIFAARGLPTEWIQGNESSSTKNVVRGLHFQRPPFAETKFVRALSGVVFDVMVDLRSESPTFGKWHAVELSSAKRNAVVIPKRFAHGFCVLSDMAVLGYLVDCPYTPAAEGGVAWNDPDLGIPWPLRGEAILSDRDHTLPRLRDLGAF